MLVTLANNQSIGAGASATYTYSPSSLQKVFLNLSDVDWEDARVTVQIGSTTICNGATIFGLAGLSALNENNALEIGGATGFVVLDFGNHILTGNDNLYVTIDAVGALTAVDVSAIVDSPGMPRPLRLTEYSDNTFTSNNNLFAIAYDSAKAAIKNDYINCEVRTSISSSSPSFCSAQSFWKSESATADSSLGYYGILNNHVLPMNTTYNYSSSAIVDKILTIERMYTDKTQSVMAKRAIQRTKEVAGR